MHSLLLPLFFYFFWRLLFLNSISLFFSFFFFFFNDTATTEIYTLSLHDALPISAFEWVSRALGTIGVLALALVLWGALRNKLRGLGRALVTSIREHRALWRSRRFWSRAGGAAALVAIGGLLVPWPITVQGVFTARPLLELAVSAPEGGVLAQVFVREGERVPPGARLALIRSFPLERRSAVLQRIVDSLSATAAQARARGPTAEVRRREAARGAWVAEQAGVERRLAALALRAPVEGVVATARLEERVGRAMAAGDEVVRLLEPDSLELVVALERAGATLVRRGQIAALFARVGVDRKSTRLNSSHLVISYAVFCLKKKK